MISTRLRFWLLPLVLIHLFLFGVKAGWTEDERISALTVEMDPQGEILVSARLIQAIQGRVANDIQHGIPKDLFYYVLLMKRQEAWFDEELLDKTIKYSVQYDVLKKLYRVYIRDEKGVSDRLVENFQEVLDLISKIDNARIADIKILKPKETYYVRVKAQMKVSRLPFYLKYVLFFIPVLELDTPWADSAPFYAGTVR